MSNFATTQIAAAAALREPRAALRADGGADAGAADADAQVAPRRRRRRRAHLRRQKRRRLQGDHLFPFIFFFAQYYLDQYYT